MKQAVIQTGGKQYIVGKDDILDIESIGDKKTVTFTPLLVMDGDNVIVGTPEVNKTKVNAKVVDQVRGDKVTSIRFKAKKRVNKKRGHRQHYSRIQITGIK